MGLENLREGYPTGDFMTEQELIPPDTDKLRVMLEERETTIVDLKRINTLLGDEVDSLKLLCRQQQKELGLGD